MIAAFQHTIRGNEFRGGVTLIQTPAIGATVLDIQVDGVSYREEEEMNEQTGVLALPFALPKRSLIRILFKTIPRFVIPIPPSVGEFSAADFSDEFAI